MTANQLLVYFLAGVGLGVGVVRVVQVMRWDLNLPGFTGALVKLIRSDNWDRSIKLCGAAPGALFVRMVEPALRAGRAEESEGLYRATAMREAYRENRGRALGPDRYGPLLSAGAALLCLAAGAMGVGYGVLLPQLAVGLVVGGGILAAYSLRFSLKIRSRGDDFFEQIVQAAQAADAGRRLTRRR